MTLCYKYMALFHQSHRELCHLGFASFGVHSSAPENGYGCDIHVRFANMIPPGVCLTDARNRGPLSLLETFHSITLMLSLVCLVVDPAPTTSPRQRSSAFP
jgi:hypothetical protein